MRGIRILERILITIPVMLGVVFAVFLFMQFIPGDPVDIMLGEIATVEERERVRGELGLDQPFHIQLSRFLAGLPRGDLGTSPLTGRPVLDMIAERFPATIELALGALFFGLIIAIPIGIISAVKQHSAIDRTSMAVAFMGISMPGFWLGIVLILIFSAGLGILPVFGRISFGMRPDQITGLYILDSILTLNSAALMDSIRHLILPAVTLGTVLAAITARVLRSSMVEVLRADYVTFARAKGARELVVVVRHALRNALIPTVTVVGIQIGVLLGGNMIVETVFAWPGIGMLAVDAIFRSDYPVIMAVVMVYAFIYVMANLLVDILYTFLNPRITL